MRKTKSHTEKGAVSLNDNTKITFDEEGVYQQQKEEILNHMLLEQLLKDLGDSERNLIKMRYFENMTQVQVARILGISQVQVSRTEKKILQGMRKNLE